MKIAKYVLTALALFSVAYAGYTYLNQVLGAMIYIGIIVGVVFITAALFRFRHEIGETLKTFGEVMKWSKRVMSSVVGLVILTTFTMASMYMFGYMYILEWAAITMLFLALWLPMILGITWKLGLINHLFFPLEEDNIAFVDSGESNVFIYVNTPGRVLKEVREVDGVVVNDYALVDEENKGDWKPKWWKQDGVKSMILVFIQNYWGLYWRGPDFLNRTVHRIPLTKKKAASNLRPGMDAKDWVTGSDEVVFATQLRRKFPRPVIIPDMKFRDGVEANLLLLGNFEVVVPRKAVYSLKGDFFSVVELYVATAMKDIGGKMDSVKFRTESQVEGSDLSTELVTIIDKILIKECGIRIKGASIPVYNLSSDEEEKAAKAAKLAEQQGEAEIVAAEKRAKAAAVRARNDAKIKLIDARAEAKADGIRNAASITDVTLAAQELARLGAHPDIAVQVAGSVGRATRYTHPESKVTTQAEGGVPVAITPSERKVVLTDK